MANDETDRQDKELKLMKLMTFRQLSELCAKGLCEWCDKDEGKVSSSIEYLWAESDSPVSNQVMIRPFGQVAFTNADKNEWYAPTEEAYNLFIGSDKTKHIFGFY